MTASTYRRKYLDHWKFIQREVKYCIDLSKAHGVKIPAPVKNSLAWNAAFLGCIEIHRALRRKENKIDSGKL